MQVPVTETKRYTVKQLARLAGVTVRTLHYYDEIGLLRPAAVGQNGYRYYGQAAVLRLQQILFYRELEVPLDQIQLLLDRSDFNLLDALRGHRAALQTRIERLATLIQTVDHTIQYLEGAAAMQDSDFYTGFDEAAQEELAEQAAQKYGESARQSQRRWQGYSRAQKNALLAEMHAISAGVAANTAHGPASPQVQQWIERWFRLINAEFFDCSLDVFEQLGHGYSADPAFAATYEAIQPGLAAFMEQAMTHFVQSKRG